MRGYTIPRTATGTSSLVPSPPWHYVGDFLVVDYWADPDAVRSILPEGLDEHPDTGRCAAVFADWQSCSEDGDELLDPVRSHYREFFIVANALLDGEEVTTCPFIWVDQDFALVRGWIQGFPKKLGEVWMTRTFGLGGPADPGLRAGARHGATCSARGRAIADMTLTIDGPTEDGPSTTRRRSSTSATSRGWPPAATTSRRSTSSFARSPVTASRAPCTAARRR